MIKTRLRKVLWTSAILLAASVVDLASLTTPYLLTTIVVAPVVQLRAAPIPPPDCSGYGTPGYWDWEWISIYMPWGWSGYWQPIWVMGELGDQGTCPW